MREVSRLFSPLNGAFPICYYETQSSLSAAFPFGGHRSSPHTHTQTDGHRLLFILMYGKFSGITAFSESS